MAIDVTESGDRAFDSDDEDMTLAEARVAMERDGAR